MYKQLTSEQRYTISVLLQKKCSLSFIAKTIGVSVSIVSLEKRRNSNVQGVYDGRLATLKARRRKAGMPSNRSISPHVRSRVFELIRRELWSPEQISGWLMKQEGLSVSKSSIYNWIATVSPYHKDNIRRHLRHGGRKARRSASSTRTPIHNRVSIDDRPAHANGQTVGDWEIDTIVGKDGKGGNCNLSGKEKPFHAHGKTRFGKAGRPTGACRRKATQRERAARKGHNHGQQDGVCST